MFALSFMFLFLSMFSAVLGFSGVAGDLSGIAISLSFLFLAMSMIALSRKWNPRSTCFIYPTFSCKVP